MDKNYDTTFGCAVIDSTEVCVPVREVGYSLKKYPKKEVKQRDFSPTKMNHAHNSTCVDTEMFLGAPKDIIDSTSVECF